MPIKDVKARRSVSFSLATKRQVRNETGSSLCNYCGREHGSVGEHVFPVIWFANSPELAIEYFTAILGREVFKEELVSLMKSETNCVLSCTRCNFDKTNGENDCHSNESKIAHSMKWLNRAKRFSNGAWISRAIKVSTGKKRAKLARIIAGKADPYKRAAARREARGKKNW